MGSATRDLKPGVTLSAGDVELTKRPTAWIPDGAADAVDMVVGATLAGPSRRGEVLTDARILAARLTGLTIGPDARMVPVHLADSAALDVIRPGDVVDVLGSPTGESDAHPRLLAGNAVVVTVSPGSGGPGASNDRVVLIALPAAAANTVAGATLVQSVTLTIH